MLKRILITGSSGFIGFETFVFFLNKNYKVYGLDKVSHKNINRNLFYKCNILDKKRLLQVLKKTNPEVIIHLAAKTDLKGKDLSYYIDNFVGTKNIIECANLLPKIKRVIFASTFLVNKIGTNNKENFNFYNPNTKYGESKVLMEKIISNSQCKFQWCIIRPTTIWGDNIQNHFKIFLDLIKKNLYFHIGYKKLYKKYGYVKNTVFQIFKIMNAKNKFFKEKTYYICDYKSIELRQWSDKISMLINGKKVKITIPIFLAKLLALLGDFFILFGFTKLPITTFRLKNILTNFNINTHSLKKLCGKLPYNLDRATINFIRSYKVYYIKNIK